MGQKNEEEEKRLDEEYFKATGKPRPHDIAGYLFNISDSVGEAIDRLPTEKKDELQTQFTEKFKEVLNNLTPPDAQKPELSQPQKPKKEGIFISFDEEE